MKEIKHEPRESNYACHVEWHFFSCSSSSPVRFIFIYFFRLHVVLAQQKLDASQLESIPSIVHSKLVHVFRINQINSAAVNACFVSFQLISAHSNSIFQTKKNKKSTIELQKKKNAFFGKGNRFEFERIKLFAVQN